MKLSPVVATLFSAFQVRHMFGEWIIWHSTSERLPPTNRVIVHVYPNDAISVSYRYECGPFVYKREKIGSYKLLEEKNAIDLTLENRPDKLLSCMGLGLGFIDIHDNGSNASPGRPFRMKLQLDLDPGKDNLFLSSENDKTCFHLVRSVRVDEPKIDIPLLRFVFTQILGNLVAQGLIEVMNEVKKIH
jgi:hypothetical protein